MEKQFKFAVLLTLYADPEQANVFIRQLLNSPGCEIFVHIDAKGKGIENSLVQDKRIHIMPQHFAVQWGDFTQISSICALMRFASSGEGFDYYSLHSGNDLLVRPYSELVDFLTHDNQYAYLCCDPLPAQNWQYGGGLGRIALKWPKCFRKKCGPYHPVRILRSLYGKLYGANLIKGRRLPEGIHFYGRSDWFTLRRDCVANLLGYLEKHPDFMELFEDSLIGSEIFFATLVHLTAGGMQVEDHNNLRYIDFHQFDKKAIGSPKTLTAEDISAVKASGRFFARKVNQGTDRDFVDAFRQVSG